MLNPGLYATMTQLYGEVKVVKPGIQSAPPQIFTHPVTHRKYCRWPDGCDKGEEYQCCCPFCGDTGFHLYVNHQYGRRDACGSVIEFATCFKGCLENPTNRHRLEYDLLFRIGRHISPEAIRKMKEVQAKEPKVTPISQTLEGVIPLKDLPDDHVAVQYLFSRNYSRSTMETYNLGFCDNPDEWITHGRLIIPVVFNGQEVCWQARKLDETARGPKYYNSRGFPKSHIVYNFDVASKQPFVVITEGVSDVWRIGAPAICTFGKNISDAQLRLIEATWKGKPIFLMLDPDAESENKKYFNILKNSSENVKMLKLPKGYKDPGCTPPEVLREIITDALNQ